MGKQGRKGVVGYVRTDFQETGLFNGTNKGYLNLWGWVGAIGRVCIISSGQGTGDTSFAYGGFQRLMNRTTLGERTLKLAIRYCALL